MSEDRLVVIKKLLGGNFKVSAGPYEVGEDVRWLIAELEKAREALISLSDVPASPEYRILTEAHRKGCVRDTRERAAKVAMNYLLDAADQVGCLIREIPDA